LDAERAIAWRAADSFDCASFSAWYRKRKGSNDDWTHPPDPDAKITKMKDGRTLSTRHCLLLTGFFAAVPAARRASSIDPVEALRSE
jgi:hypothetical protein